MTTHAPPQADADYLTAILRKAKALGRSRVVAARVVHAFPTVLSRFHRLKLDYDGTAEGAPRHLYLKTGLPDSPGAAMDSGRREVAFYTDVAPTTPAGLLPRCFEAQASDGPAWHLLLEDLTDTHFITTQWPLPRPWPRPRPSCAVGRASRRRGGTIRGSATALGTGRPTTSSTNG